ncbi:MAG: hypothetical protein LBU11_06310, partial [Zoogloeaceae bacterium]|nr:hypothetical protein [Zoogloeaceae bacterium]
RRGASNRDAGRAAHVRWDEKGSATALEQSGFLAEFLEETGLFERRGKRCPLVCASPDAPEGVDVPRTWRLSILDGQRRYAHYSSVICNERIAQ